MVGVITATKAILNWVYWETKKLEVKEDRIKEQKKAFKSRCFNGKQRQNISKKIIYYSRQLRISVSRRDGMQINVLQDEVGEDEMDGFYTGGNWKIKTDIISSTVYQYSNQCWEEK